VPACLPAGLAEAALEERPGALEALEDRPERAPDVLDGLGATGGVLGG
jgi:hypothetical protein